MTGKWVGVLTGAVLGLSVTMAVAHGTKAEDAVEYRKSVFHVIAWNFGPMVAMVKGEMEYDAEAFTLRAERMSVLSSQALEGFLPDTLVGDSESKPEIWENWADFEAKMGDLEETTAALAEASLSGDMATIMPAFKATGGACKACHDDYKEE